MGDSDVNMIPSISDENGCNRPVEAPIIPLQTSGNGLGSGGGGGGGVVDLANERFESALKQMSSTKPALLKAALRAELKMLQLLEKKPDEVKNRRMRLDNIAIKKYVTDIPGGQAFFEAIGFRQKEAKGVQYLTIEPSDLNRDVLSRGIALLTEKVATTEAAEQTATPVATGPRPYCKGGCGFFGDAETEGYCSQCHRKKISAGGMRTATKPAPAAAVVPPGRSPALTAASASHLVDRSPSISPRPPPSPALHSSATASASASTSVSSAATASTPSIISAPTPSLASSTFTLDGSTPAPSSSPPPTQSLSPPLQPTASPSSTPTSPSLAPISDSKQSSAPQRCTKGCGFWGQAKFNGMCSMCYSKQPNLSKLWRAHFRRAILKLKVVRRFEAGKRPPQTERNRCWKCRHRVGITGFECRCGYVFCGKHRHANEHDCSYDFKKLHRRKLANENKRVAGEKFEKIDQ